MTETSSRPDTEPRSLWRAVSPPRITSDALTGAIDTEVAIIGGGFTGLSAALHLLKSGRNVCLRRLWVTILRRRDNSV